MTGRLRLALLPLVLAAALGAQEPVGERAQDEVVLGRSSALNFSQGAGETLSLVSGSRLFQYPDARSLVLEVLAQPSEAEILGRHGGWAEVRVGSWRGWVPVDGELPLETTPALVLPPARPDTERLARARRILGEREITSTLGPFGLHTDVVNERLLATLAAVAADLPRAYAERYGVTPVLAGSEAVVLFRHEKDYRVYEAEEPAIAGLDTLGHTSSGLSVLFVGGRPSDETRQLLLHELVHLLNRLAFGRELPPWLEEGLAEDLSFCAVDERGRLKLSTLGAQGTTVATVIRGKRGALKLQSPRTKVKNPFGGTPRASLAWLVHEWNNPARPSLELLLELPWVGFVQPGYRQFYYGQSGFLIRYLLDADRGARRVAMRRYMAAIAAGAEPSSEELWRLLDVTPRQLERGFHTWLWNQAAANGIPTPDQVSRR